MERGKVAGRQASKQAGKKGSGRSEGVKEIEGTEGTRRVAV